MEIIMIIGITGASGAGKSVASKCFEKIGFKIVDLDKITHEIYKTDKECVGEIKAVFGDEVIDQNGDVLRKRLGEIVFNDSQKLNILNNLVHKYILKKAMQEIKTHKNIVLDAPLLFEAGLDKMCDITLGIISSKNENAKRITQRDDISLSLANKRLDNQHDNLFFEKNCTFCIHNNSNVDSFIKKVDEFIKNEVTRK